MISTSQYGLVLRSPDRSFIVNSGITAQFYSHTILLSVPVQFYKVSYEQGAIDSFFCQFPWRIELISLAVRKNLLRDLDISPAKTMEPDNVMWLKTITEQFGDSPIFSLINLFEHICISGVLFDKNCLNFLQWKYRKNSNC